MDIVNNMVSFSSLAILSRVTYVSYGRAGKMMIESKDVIYLLVNLARKVSVARTLGNTSLASPSLYTSL